MKKSDRTKTGGRCRGPVIDAHIHFGAKYKSEYFESRYDPEKVREELEGQGIVHCIGLSIFPGGPFEREERYVNCIGTEYVSRFAPVDISDAQERGYEKKMAGYFSDLGKKGVSGIKMWKDISLVRRRKDGKHWKMTDPELEVIFREAGERGMPVTVHMADPPDFFRPMDENNPRIQQLLQMPKWCYASDPELSFSSLMEQQEELLEKYRNTTFIIAHMGCWGEDLEMTERWLEKYPNMMTDTSACLYELGIRPEESRDFFIRYADRILFGTDLFAGEEMHFGKWFRFLETEEQFYVFDKVSDSGFGSERVTGLNLPDSVLDRVYYTNALRVLGFS